MITKHFINLNQHAMKKSTFLKMAFTLCGAIFFSGAFAQVTLTIKNSDGTPSGSAVVYTKLSSTGVQADIVTADALGVAVLPNAAGNYNYIIRNAANNQWNSYSFTAPAAATAVTIYLKAAFNPVVGDYVSVRTADKVTHTKPMPFWVYPSPAHNPAYVAPSGAYVTRATIVTGLVSKFAWTLPANTVDVDAVATDDNYVQLVFTPDLSAAATTTVQRELSVIETPDAAFGGCAASAVKFFANIINPPYAQINGTVASDAVPATTLTIATAAYRELGRACDVVNTNIEVAFPNTEEDFPYYVRLKYNVYNPTLVGTNLTLGAALAAASFPAAARPQGFGGGDANLSTNPMSFGATPSNFYAAAVDFPVVNGAITVYEFDLNEWNGKISRKSDYIAFRDAAVKDATKIEDANYSWYSNAALAGTFDATSLVKKAYIVVFPKPVTGPIYHIANTFGL